MQLPLFDGALVLQAEAGVRQDVREADGALVEFWRPIVFGDGSRPIGGRMDCRLGGVRQDYSNALFDIRRRYRDSRNVRQASGLNDGSDDYVEQGNIRRLEVVGSANTPHRHYVLTFLAMHAGDYLYDIRMNCEFRHLQDPGGKTDYAAIMRDYVDIAVPALSPAASPSTPDRPDQ